MDWRKKDACIHIQRTREIYVGRERKAGSARGGGCDRPSDTGKYLFE